MASLRAKKKKQRREALIASAYRLFEKKGYDATTIEEITEGAECSPRTFFQYFKSKEELLLIGMDEFWEGFATALASRPADVTVLQALDRWMREMMSSFTKGESSVLNVLDREKENTRISLQSRLELYSMQRTEEILAPEFADELGFDREAIEPRLLARAAAVLFDAHHDPSFSDHDPYEFGEKVMHLLEGAVAALSDPGRRERSSRA